MEVIGGGGGGGNEVARSASSRKLRLGRKISRRLSLVTRVPNLIGVRLKQEFGSRDSLRGPQQPRHLEIVIIAPDKTQRIVGAASPQRVFDVVASIISEFRLTDIRLTLAGSSAEVDPDADVALLEGDVLIVEDNTFTPNPRSATDKRFGLCEMWSRDEQRYVQALKSAVELYGSPLSKLGCISTLEYSVIFEGFSKLAAYCQQIVDKMKELLEKWDPENTSVGHLFDEPLWDHYQEYQDMYRNARQMLREKTRSDDDFLELCKLRRGAAKHTLHSLLELPVHRLSQYEQYFESLLSQEQRLDHEEITNARAKVKQSVKRGQEESDLERIQDLFPNDSLRLYDRDALTMRMKGLMRKRSGAAARLQRALSAKSLRSESPPRHPNNNNQHQHQEKRQFIMEAPVQFTAGVTSQDRHLFLFNDLLLIAKARSGGNFKLKEKVRVSEVWMTKCAIDVVSEIPKSSDTSFVLGWPTTNVVATFTTQAARDLWWNKLSEMVNVEKSKEPCTTNIQVTYFDQATSIEYCKTFSIGPDETARSCIKQALEHLEMRGCEAGGYQLWAKTGRDESPYPLIGHERPFAIKLSCLRDNLATEETNDLDHCNNIHDPLARCQFILRNASKAVESEKKTNKKTGSKIRIGQVFRRSISKENTGCLFGLPLSRICEGDALPRPVMAMLQQVFTKGPFTQGIFRKSANARLVRELREKLDLGEAVSLDHVPVLVTAALLKEFLRSLPDPLLGSNLYPQWRAALDTPNIHQRIMRLKRVLEQLPKPNLTLLAHFLCVLYRVSRRASQNLMSAANLGVCVGPSLLWSDSAVGADDLRAVPLLVENLITHCEVLVGPQLTQLMGDPRDSGTEESDSLRRDDSSIDSLECSPPPRKDKISLSRDSGLTMSDSQLYTPDEEESGSTSSSGYDPAFDPHTKVTPSLSVPPEYVRVYGGWEERLNPNFQRQAWFRQRSRRLNCAPPVKQEVAQVRRSASEESLLDGPPTPPRRNKPELRTDGNQVIVSADAIRPNNFKSELSIKPVFDELFKRHPPLRKVTAVHCEVISEPRRHQYRETQPLYANTKKSMPTESKKENFPRPVERTPEMYYSPKQSFSPQYTPRLDTSESSLYKTCVSELTPPPPPPPPKSSESGDYYRSREDCDDSSTLSDDDWTPHVSRSNSRGNEVTPKLRHLPPVHVEGTYLRGRLKNKEERPAHRSRSLPPPPSFSTKSSATSRRAPITSYYLGDCNQTHYVVTRSYRDEESYV